MRQLFLVIILAVTGKVYAQNGLVTGKVSDESGKALALATVTVFKAADTSIVTYRMSSNSGDFRIPNLPLNINLRILITFSGFDAYRREFTLTESRSSLALDTIQMVPTTKDLEDIIVIAERPPVVIKNDTIEFNANAFKTLPNALVEDLLRKLPGVRVDADGNITVNGKAVNKIMVDGKSFFGDDPKMATRNLPANAIDKVQVVDDKEQALLNGDNNTSNVGKVINITLKKGFKKGAFGKLYAGAGTKDRYELGGILNVFRDTLQVSVLGYSNNLNRPGFSYGELMNAGGMSRSNANRNNNSTSMWNSNMGSSIMINGVNFGGTNDFGLAVSNGVGFNLNHAPDKKKSMYLQYYFGEVRRTTETNRLTRLFNADTTIENQQNGNSLNKNYGHNFGAGAKLNPDSLTTINLNASYTIGLQRNDINNVITSENNLLGDLSDGNIFQHNNTDNYNYSHNFYLIRKGRKNNRRNFIISNMFNTGTNTADNQTNAVMLYYQPIGYDSVLNQARNVRLPQTSATLNIGYREPLTKMLSLRFNNRFRYNYIGNYTNTYNAITNNGKYDIFNPLLSDAFKRTRYDVAFFQGLQFAKGGWTITPNIGELILNSHVQVETVTGRINQNVRKLVPGLDISYKNLSISYTKDYVLPEYMYLLPVLDNSDPYYVSNGNPYLQLTKQNAIDFNANFNNQQHGLSVWFWASAAQKDNDVIQSVMVTEQGVQVTTPVNANGTRSFRTNYNINKDIKLGEKNKLSLSVGGYHEFVRNRMIFNSDTSWQTTARFSNWSGVNLNFNDVIEWNSSYNPYFNFTKYTNANFSRINIAAQSVSSGLVVRYPKHVIWETNMEYNYNSSLNTGNKNMWRWTAAINFTFLKDEKGVLKLMAYDILNQNIRYVQIYASRNTWYRSAGTMMPRYFMATFTYNIRQLGAKQKVGGRSLFSM